MKYPTLFKIIKNEFSYILGLNRDEGIEYVTQGIKNNIYDIVQIKNEYDEAIIDLSYDWVNFAIKSQMHWDATSYSNLDIINYLKYYLNDIVYPEERIPQVTYEKILEIALDKLQSLPIDNHWIELKELYNHIEKKLNKVELPYYVMYKLMIQNGYKIEGKSERGKMKESIYLKYAD